MEPMVALLAATLMAMTPAPAAASCPAAVRDQLDGLYRWQLQQQKLQENGRQSLEQAIASQRDRFTPGLFRLLQQAFALTPAADGRFVDFDVFSGTQVETLGARVLGCSSPLPAGLKAQVAVQASLRGRPAQSPQLLTYSLKPAAGGAWRIDDISYPGEAGFRLRPFLRELLLQP